MRLSRKQNVEGCNCSNLDVKDIKSFETNVVPDMIKVMGNNGVGLASPQVGLNVRMFIMKDIKTQEVVSIYNPKIAFQSPQKESMVETCLTYPSREYGGNNMMRSKTIGVEYVDSNGELVTKRLKGFQARIFQHEFDHLEGLTIFFRG